MDGWITIGTKLSTDKFDKQISELENKIDSEEKKQELLNNKTNEYERELDGVNKQAEELNKQYDEAVTKAKQLQNEAQKYKPGSIQNFMLTQDYEEQVKQIDKINESLGKVETKQISLKNKVKQTTLQHENSVKAVDRLRGKIDQINLKRHQNDAKAIEKTANNIKNEVTSTIGKVGKLALAVLGVRSAYSLLRRASSEWASYNQQYAKDLEYIRFAIANGLAPILEKIVLLSQTLMAYVNYLSNAWFGKQIFASAKDFEKMSKSASGVAKSTKEIKNNLASFDELNVLSKNNGAEAGGGVSPSIDLGNFEDIEIPEWLVKIKDILQPVVDFFTEINEKYGPVATGIGIVVAALAGFYILKGIIGLLTGFSGALFGVTADFTGFLNSIGKAVKAIAILGGLALVINAVSNLIKTFAESGLKLNEVIGLMATILASIAITMALVAVLGPAVTAGLIPFLGVIAGISALLAVMALTLPTILEAVGKFVDVMAPALSTVIEAISKGISVIIEALGTALPPIIRSIGDLFTSVFNGIAKIIETVGNTIIDLQKSTIDFITELGPAINSFVDGVLEAITKLINFLISGIEYMVNLIIGAINKIIDGINVVGDVVGKTINHVPEFNLPKFTPKLAKGGIVAKPTQAIIGEAGKEAVLPLDSNTEWMDILAEKLSDRAGGGQEVTIKFAGTMAQFVRELKPQIDIENKRAGARLITGGAY